MGGIVRICLGQAGYVWDTTVRQAGYVWDRQDMFGALLSDRQDMFGTGRIWLGQAGYGWDRQDMFGTERVVFSTCLDAAAYSVLIPSHFGNWYCIVDVVSLQRQNDYM